MAARVAGPRFGNRLSVRHARAAVTAGLGIGLVVVGIQVSSDLRIERRRIADIGPITATLIRSQAARAAYRLDGVLAEEIVRGAIVTPGLLKAEIIDDFGDVLAGIERPPTWVSPQWLVALLAMTPRVTEEALFVEGHRFVGTLRLTVLPAEAAGGLFERVRWILFSGLLRILALTAVLLFLFNRLTTRRINAVMQRLRQDGGLIAPIGDDDDELDQLAHSVEAWQAERTRLHDALRNERDRLALAAASGEIGIWEWSARDNRLTWDDRMFALYGLKRTDVFETFDTFASWIRALHPDDRERVVREFREAQQARSTFNSEFRMLRSNGEIRYVRASAVALMDADGRLERLIGTNLDMTEKRLMDERMAQAARAEALGQLSGGLAHDFNNLLSVIRGNLEMLQLSELAAFDRKSVDVALDAVSRGARLTAELLAVGRRSQIRPQPIRAEESFARLVEMVRRILPEAVRLETGAAPDLPPFRADAAMLDAALLNLIINARDAMTEGGALRVTACALTLDDKSVRAWSHDMTAGCYVQVEIADDGPGMTPEVLARALEPFYTTKPVGKGSGLGLSMVHGFMKQSGGGMRILSGPTRGTMVQLAFPVDRSMSPAPSAEGTRPVAKAADLRGLCVLIIDDEPDVRKVMCRMLESVGCVAAPAADGAAALEMADEGAQFDAVLSDITMPGEPTGAALAEALRARLGDVPVIFMSGDPGGTFGSGDQGSLSATVLLKPVSLETLTRHLHAAVQSRKTAPSRV